MREGEKGAGDGWKEAERASERGEGGGVTRFVLWSVSVEGKWYGVETPAGAVVRGVAGAY